MRQTDGKHIAHTEATHQFYVGAHLQNGGGVGGVRDRMAHFSFRLRIPDIGKNGFTIPDMASKRNFRDSRYFGEIGIEPKDDVRTESKRRV
jgi:hypothetical protein